MPAVLGSSQGNPAGTPGEPVSSVVTVALGSGFTIAQFGNVTSIALTAGDWDLTGVLDAAFLTSLTRITVALSLFSGNTTTDHVTGLNVMDCPLGVTGALHGSISIPNWQVVSDIATTVFLKAQLTGAVGNILLGRLSARRER
jgi:hypothetical protein